MLETLNPYLFGMGLSGIPASTGRAPFFGAYQKPAAPESMGPMMQQAYDLSGVGAMPAAFTSGPYGKVIEPPNPDFLPPGSGGNPPGGNPPGGNPLPPPPTPAGYEAARTSFLTNALRDYAAIASRAGYNGMKAYQEAANVIPGVMQRFVGSGQLPDYFQVPSSGELMKLHQPGVDLSGYALGDDGSPLRHGSTWNDNYFLKHWNPDQPTPNSPPAINAPGGNAPGGNAPGGNPPGGNPPGGNAPGGNAPGGNPLPTPPTPAGYEAARTSFLTNALRDYAAIASRAGYNGMNAYQEASNVIPGVTQRFVGSGQLPDYFQVPSSGELMKLHQPGVDLSGYALGDDASPLKHGSTWNDNYFLKHWNPDQPTPNSPPPAVNAPPPGAPTKPPYVPNDYLLPPQVTTGINQLLPQAAGTRRRAGISGAQQYLGTLSPEQLKSIAYATNQRAALANLGL